MDELMDLMVNDESPSQISDKIKDLLYAKSADKIQGIKPDVAAQLFDNGEESNDEVDTEVEAQAEVEAETEVETEEQPVEQGVEN